MKIKTITCHDVYNVGASLQAFALAAYLKDIGHDVEIVNYKPDYLVHYKLTGVANPRYDKTGLREIYQILKFPGRWRAKHSRRKKEYDMFTAQMLPVTERKYTSNEDLKQNPPEADVFFAGSDQIWNTFFRNGKDAAFYLDFAPEGAVRASYAASFSTEDIQEEWKPQVKKWLSALDFISVRESSGVKIVKNLGIDGVVQTLDPVFLLGEEVWKNVEKHIEIHEPYLLLYDFDGNLAIEKYVKRIAGRNGWKIYSILPSVYCDRCFDQEGPQAFLYLIHHAQFIVSNSFHATVFSLIYKKQFVVFNRNEKINTRMQDLLGLVDLQNRLIIDANTATTDADINYLQVQRQLAGEIQKSKAYITAVLQSSEHVINSESKR